MLQTRLYRTHPWHHPCEFAKLNALDPPESLLSLASELQNRIFTVEVPRGPRVCSSHELDAEAEVPSTRRLRGTAYATLTDMCSQPQPATVARPGRIACDAAARTDSGKPTSPLILQSSSPSPQPPHHQSNVSRQRSPTNAAPAHKRRSLAWRTHLSM